MSEDEDKWTRAGLRIDRQRSDDGRARSYLQDTKLTSARSRQAGTPRPLRVLLAEDDLTNALLANTVMKMLGCEVVTANTGGEAVSAVKQEPFDIVLMDFHMPVMNGLAATRSIREWENDAERLKDSRNPARIPILAITASAMPAEREACLDAGMDDVLTKPFRLEDLRLILEKWAG